MKRSFILFTIFAVVVVVGTATIAIWLSPNNSPMIAVSDVMKHETFILRASPGSKGIYALNVHCLGTIDGSATVTLMVNGAPYKVAQISGNVDFRWGGDWYYDAAEIRYEPGDVKAGTLVLHYDFES